MITYREILAVFKGLRNGLEYGSKVRFVHSLVITMLFKNINQKELYNIFKLALEHGKNLGLFVFAYKFSTLVLEKVFGKNSANNFVSGFIFGGLIFGKQTPVNHQIVLYLLSRVLTAAVALIYKKYMRERW
jgi:peroxisomal membrane protein 4